MTHRGNVFVVSAPSGAGKHTIIKRAMERDPLLSYSISATTREPRDGETDGEDYYFLSRDEFEGKRAAGAFVEWAEVHGNYYGTLKSELERIGESDKDVILELDVQGMRLVRGSGLDVVTIFIAPPSFDELERRLRHRGTNSEEDIEVRLENAREELRAQDEYDYVIVNEEIDSALRQFLHIVRAHRT